MRTALLIGLTTTLLILAACGSSRRSAPITGEREITDSSIQLGKQVFDSNCDMCHPGGSAGLGPALNDKPLPNWLVRFQVRKGMGVMPSFSDDQISDDELRALSRYVTWLRHQ